MNNNLLLYGSVARGDSTKFSDIDLLSVGPEFSNKYIVKNINVSYYNLEKLREMSKSGSLFVYHLNQEAKIIFDDAGILGDIIYRDFSLKSNYYEDVSFAFDLLNEISRNYQGALNYSFANSKIAWCLRTIYAGMGANMGIPMFSKKGIVKNFGKDSIEYLKIKNKSTNQQKIFPKISIHLNSIVEKETIQSIPIRKDLKDFKEKVLNSIIDSNYEYELIY